MTDYFLVINEAGKYLGPKFFDDILDNSYLSSKYFSSWSVMDHSFCCKRKKTGVSKQVSKKMDLKKLN